MYLSVMDHNLNLCDPLSCVKCNAYVCVKDESSSKAVAYVHVRLYEEEPSSVVKWHTVE
jgi:hypothetical protein